MSMMKNTMIGNSRLDTAEENVRDLECLARKIIKNKRNTKNKVLPSW